MIEQFKDMYEVTVTRVDNDEVVDWSYHHTRDEAEAAADEMRITYEGHVIAVLEPEVTPLAQLEREVEARLHAACIRHYHAAPISAIVRDFLTSEFARVYQEIEKMRLNNDEA